MKDEPKKQPIPAKAREQMDRGISQRKAVSYADLPKSGGKEGY